MFFDVDGTLVPGTSSSVLAGFLGHRDELARAEDAYAAGELDNRRVSELDAAGWAGVPVQRVARRLDELPLIPGIAETVAWCRGHGLAPFLATLAWSPVGSHLSRRFGFHGSAGPRLETAGGACTGQVARHFDEYDKRDAALSQARRLGMDSGSCGAIGDSRSDLPPFASVGLSVAFNASAGARAAATVSVDGGDLRSVLPALGRMVSAARRQPADALRQPTSVGAHGASPGRGASGEDSPVDRVGPMAATESRRSAERGLRADALRNRQRIVAAARGIFEERGLDAPLDEVAERAGVGAGTLYRRFASREELVEAAFAEELAQVEAIAEEALLCEDPWTGFSTFVERLCAAMAADRGVSDLLVLRLPTSTMGAAFCDRQNRALARLVRRGQEAGALRADVVPEDVLLFLMANAGVIEVTRDAAPHAWRRLVAFLLEACRPVHTGALPAPPTPLQTQRALLGNAEAKGLRAPGRAGPAPD